MLVLRPIGRGSWAPVTLHIPTQRKEFPLPIEVRVGRHVTIDGRVYRIAKVLP
jgi:hypothetical protein